MRALFFSLACMMSLSLRAQTVLVVQEGLDQVVLFSPDDPIDRKVIHVGSKPHEIELTPDGRTAYVSNFGLLEVNHKEGTPGTTISVLDVGRRVERTRFTLPAEFTAPHGLKLRPPEYRELFTNSEEGKGGMVVFDAASGSVLRTFPLPNGVHNFMFSADGSAIFAFTTAGEVCRIDPGSGAVIARVETGSPRGLAWNSGHSLLIASGKDELVLLDPSRLSVVRRLQKLGVGQIFYPAATPDGRWILAPAVLDGVVLVIDAFTGAVAHRIETGSPLLVTIEPDGKQAWVSNVKVPAGTLGPAAKPRAGGVARLDLTTFTVDPVPSIRDANGLAISPNP
jgi:DNA-binding beta-propeller fold protein YncE